MSEARDITLGLGGRWDGQQGTACCPAHEDRNPSLSIGEGDDGRSLLHCHAGCPFEAIIDALKAKGLVSAYRTSPRPAANEIQWRRRERLAHNTKHSRQALDIWESARSIEGTLAERYLSYRGISGPLPPILRYIGDCWHQSERHLPAMIARVVGADGCAIHRTYLAGDGRGKADVDPVKAMLGPTKGGAVRLSHHPGRLVVAEGIETALSLGQLLEEPASIWAALSAGGIRSLRLPRRPGDLLIAADGDVAGLAAAEKLAERARAEGWQAALKSAPDGIDWNDVLTGKGKAA